MKKNTVLFLALLIPAACGQDTQDHRSSQKNDLEELVYESDEDFLSLTQNGPSCQELKDNIFRHQHARNIRVRQAKEAKTEKDYQHFLYIVTKLEKALGILSSKYNNSCLK